MGDMGCLKSCPEPVKEAPGKRKKEMAKQKAAPEAKKQKVEGKLAELLGGWGAPNGTSDEQQRDLILKAGVAL